MNIRTRLLYRRVNTALDDICNVHINSTEYKAEFTGLCTMMSMKPMQFASVLRGCYC